MPGLPTREVKAVHRAVTALLQDGSDLRKARELAQRAVDLRPKNMVGHRILAQVYIAAGMKLNARRELDADLKLDPKDEIVKNLLREVKD